MNKLEPKNINLNTLDDSLLDELNDISFSIKPVMKKQEIKVFIPQSKKNKSNNNALF